MFDVDFILFKFYLNKLITVVAFY